MAWVQEFKAKLGNHEILHKLKKGGTYKGKERIGKSCIITNKITYFSSFGFVFSFYFFWLFETKFYFIVYIVSFTM